MMTTTCNHRLTVDNHLQDHLRNHQHNQANQHNLQTYQLHYLKNLTAYHNLQYLDHDYLLTILYNNNQLYHHKTTHQQHHEQADADTHHLDHNTTAYNQHTGKTAEAAQAAKEFLDNYRHHLL